MKGTETKREVSEVGYEARDRARSFASLLIHSICACWRRR